MRSWLTYIFLSMVACATVLTSCTDVLSEEGFGNCDDRTTVRLTISFGGDNGPMSRDVDSNNGTIPELDNTTSGQAEINAGDIYALVVDASGNFLYRIKDLEIKDGPANDGYYTRTLEGTMIQTNNNVRIVLLANLIQNKITVNTTTLDSKSNVETFIDGYEGQSVDVNTIYNQLIYNYDGTITTDSETNTQVGTGPWSLSNRRIPMWGQSQETTVPPAKDVTLTCYLYRAVAKVQIWVNEKKGIFGADGVEDTAENDDTQDDFKITKITVNNANNKGYCVSSANFDTNSEHYDGLNVNPYAAPSVPAECTPQTVVYEVSDRDSNSDEYNDAREAYSDFIYLPEQFNTGEGNTPVTLSVEYVYNGKSYTGENALTINFKENGTGPAFDVIRNHSYIFNIIKAENDITFTVNVAQWEEDNMRGVPDQYTLTTDKSVITYEAYNDKNGQTIDIWTDYSDGWYLEGLDEAESAWLNISANSGEDNLTKTITLTPKTDNNGVTRTASFYVVAGNIKKEITVRQPQPPTANCYVRGNGEYELIVTIKGNGNDGIMPEGADIVPGDGDASITPDKIGIIWETKAGLVKLLDPLGEHVTNTEGQLTLVDYNKTTNSIKYYVDITGATIGGAVGGNALIGAFNAAGEVIWSWHIWVSPDLIDPTTQIVKESAVEKWTLNDYDVLDRNLGALANRPINNNSVASMGLLYQWGRKDPFIGAKYSNDNFTGNGLLDVVHYYDKWDIDNLNGSTANAIEHTIANPTHLIHNTGTGWNSTSEGLASLVENGGYLWGTDKGFVQDIIDLGSKTIYDPCPVGYRVPPVDAFVFKKQETTTEWSRGETFETITINRYSSKDYDFAVYYKRTDRNDWTLAENGTISNNNNSNRSYNVAYAISSEVLNTIFTSEETNWNENLIYIPHRATGTRTSGNIWYYVGNYVTNANYYGFWMNYTENSVPALASGNHTDGEIHYELANYNNLTWLPLTGAYDPTKGFAFKDDDGNTIQVTQGSSLTVNSFLWTNSRITNENDNKVPGAMFLHGTEVNSTVNGRHIHYLNATDITAEPHQAGAVRCVRDRVKTKWDENTLSSTASIGNTVGSTTTINIVSVNADWELIDPGQPWLQVTPDKGSADKGAGTEITLKMLEAGHSGKTTTLVFKIANESEVRKCVVTVE